MHFCVQAPVNAAYTTGGSAPSPLPTGSARPPSCHSPRSLPLGLGLANVATGQAPRASGLRSPLSTQATARGHHELPGVSGGSPGGALRTGNKVLLERGARRHGTGRRDHGSLGSCAHRVPHRVDSTPGLPLLSWGDRPDLGSKTAASRDSPESLPEPADQDQLEHGGGGGHRPGLWGCPSCHPGAGNSSLCCQCQTRQEN